MKMKSPPDSRRVVSPVALFGDVDRLEGDVAVRSDDLGPKEHVDVRAARELVDEIPGHALVERLAAVHDRHAARVGGEEHRCLAGRVAGADDVDVQTMRVRRLAAGRAVEDPLAGKPVEAVDREPPPGDAAREDDRARAQDVAAVEMDVQRRRVDSRDRPRDENLGAEPTRLL